MVDSWRMSELDLDEKIYSTSYFLFAFSFIIDYCHYKYVVSFVSKRRVVELSHCCFKWYDFIVRI